MGSPISPILNERELGHDAIEERFGDADAGSAESVIESIDESRAGECG